MISRQRRRLGYSYNDDKKKNDDKSYNDYKSYSDDKKKSDYYKSKSDDKSYNDDDDKSYNDKSYNDKSYNDDDKSGSDDDNKGFTTTSAPGMLSFLPFVYVNCHEFALKSKKIIGNFLSYYEVWC